MLAFGILREHCLSNSVTDKLSFPLYREFTRPNDDH